MADYGSYEESNILNADNESSGHEMIIIAKEYISSSIACTVDMGKCYQMWLSKIGKNHLQTMLNYTFQIFPLLASIMKKKKKKVFGYVLSSKKIFSFLLRRNKG